LGKTLLLAVAGAIKECAEIGIFPPLPTRSSLPAGMRGDLRIAFLDRFDARETRLASRWTL
jgi:hypothetical protein